MQSNTMAGKWVCCPPNSAAVGRTQAEQARPSPCSGKVQSAQPGTRRGSQRKLTSPRRAVLPRTRVRTHAPPTQAMSSAHSSQPGRGARCRTRWPRPRQQTPARQAGARTQQRVLGAAGLTGAARSFARRHVCRAPPAYSGADLLEQQGVAAKWPPVVSPFLEHEGPHMQLAPDQKPCRAYL